MMNRKFKYTLLSVSVSALFFSSTLGILYPFADVPLATQSPKTGLFLLSTVLLAVLLCFVFIQLKDLWHARDVGDGMRSIVRKMLTNCEPAHEQFVFFWIMCDMRKEPALYAGQFDDCNVEVLTRLRTFIEQKLMIEKEGFKSTECTSAMFAEQATQLKQLEDLRDVIQASIDLPKRVVEHERAKQSMYESKLEWKQFS